MVDLSRFRNPSRSAEPRRTELAPRVGSHPQRGARLVRLGSPDLLGLRLFKVQQILPPRIGERPEGNLPAAGIRRRLVGRQPLEVLEGVELSGVDLDRLLDQLSVPG